MYQQNRDLLEEINEKKSKLYDTVSKKGIMNEETIQHSQELDELIYQYQRIIHKSPERTEEKQPVLPQMMYIMPAIFAEV